MPEDFEQARQRQADRQHRIDYWHYTEAAKDQLKAALDTRRHILTYELDPRPSDRLTDHERDTLKRKTDHLMNEDEQATNLRKAIGLINHTQKLDSGD